jgi:RNA polymerase sigma-70 factor (ECF subfamily)
MKAQRELPDEVLVVAAILGDLSAFDELVLRYRPAVVRTAEAVVGRDDAEDVAQDSILLAFKALPSIDDPARFAAWLMVITRHRALRYVRGQKRDIPLDELLLDRLEALATPADREAEDAALREALERLPPEYALVLRLQFFDEMPQQRIAKALGVPVSTVKWRVYRGKQLLREVLDRS